MKTGIRIAFILLFSLFTLHDHLLHAQKVALVLSGGGSKGAAHIGVIRALEEQNIPIDYITGTSIGAAIAALYAIGYTPDQMEELVASPEFNDWVNGITDPKYIMYYRKESPNASWVSFDFQPGKKLTSFLPTSLVSTQIIDFELMRIFAPGSAAGGNNFDSLMIPFRCVVADIDSSRQIILRNGDLASAVRGSMSLPFVFTPMEINGKLVFDGGMYNNFPGDVARDEFRPDIIIGSRVAERFEKAAADDVLSMFLSMMMNRQADTLTGSNVAMVIPSLPQVNLLDFASAEELIDSGYQACIRQMPGIRKMVGRSVTIEEMTGRRERFRMKEPPLAFDSVIVNGLSKSQSEYVCKYLQRGDRSIPTGRMRDRYFLLLDEGFIRRIHPIARFNPATNKYELVLDIQKSDNFTLQFGGNISLGTSNEGFLELKYKYLWKAPLQVMANGYFGRFYNSVRAGSRIDFNGRLPFYMDLYYTYNRYDYFKNTTYFFDDVTPSYLIQWESYVDLNGGVPIGVHGKASLGILYTITTSKYYQSNIFSRGDTADQTNFDFFSPHLCYELNTLNHKQYPNTGVRLKISLSYINGLEYTLPGSSSPDKTEDHSFHDWLEFRVIYDNYFEAMGPLKLGLYAEGVISGQPLFYNSTASLLYASSFEPTPEMQSLFLPSFRAYSYAALGMKTILKVYKKIEFRAEGYILQPYQEILNDEATGEPKFGPAYSDRSYTLSGTLVYKSILGPISLGVSFYDKLEQPFTVNLNFGYIIFNPRALR
jgi:NTE family protein